LPYSFYEIEVVRHMLFLLVVRSESQTGKEWPKFSAVSHTKCCQFY